MKKKREKELPAPYAAETRDQRYAGTFEVLVPVPERVRPHRVPMQFDTLEKAQSWIHTPEGRDTIAEILKPAKK